MEDSLWRNMKNVMGEIHFKIALCHESIFEKNDFTNEQFTQCMDIYKDAINNKINNKEFCKKILAISNSFSNLDESEGEDVFIDEKIIDFYKFCLCETEKYICTKKKSIAYDITFLLRNINYILALKKRRYRREYWKKYVVPFLKCNKIYMDDFKRLKFY